MIYGPVLLRGSVLVVQAADSIGPIPAGGGKESAHCAWRETGFIVIWRPGGFPRMSVGRASHHTHWCNYPEDPGGGQGGSRRPVHQANATYGMVVRPISTGPRCPWAIFSPNKTHRRCHVILAHPRGRRISSIGQGGRGSVPSHRLCVCGCWVLSQTNGGYRGAEDAPSRQSSLLCHDAWRRQSGYARRANRRLRQRATPAHGRRLGGPIDDGCKDLRWRFSRPSSTAVQGTGTGGVRACVRRARRGRVGHPCRGHFEQWREGGGMKMGWHGCLDGPTSGSPLCWRAASLTE